MSSPESITILGVDTGGTFTDFVLLRDGQLSVHKVLSTPAQPEEAILAGTDALGCLNRELRLVHGSTVATNAVLEGKGVRTAYVCNRGLRDVLTIGRQQRAELYNLQPDPVPPPVPRELCVETGGRLGADGSVVEPLSEDDLDALATRIRQLNPEAIAINLLFSFLDDRFERAIEQAMPADILVSRSSAVLPEQGEYERGIATWLNAYVGPLMANYLQRLTQQLPDAHVAVMQSSGTTLAAEQVHKHSVHLLLSGPAGGLAGARYLGNLAGEERLLSFDMGGTSTDVALIDGEIRLTSEGHVGRFPVTVPMVDMHTIGAGGGSLARLDAGGMLLVGPESAGASPGPACYGLGGTQATVTDANLVLGRLPDSVRLGGTHRLDPGAARDALEVIATPMGVSPEEAAEGVIRVANEHMVRALRVISVERGFDPREFTLFCFGGAGGLHVCALAEALDMRKAMVPMHAGVLSALGMLVAEPGRQRSRGMVAPLADVAVDEIAGHFDALFDEARQELEEEDVPVGDLRELRSLDLRYQGQSYTLNVPWRESEIGELFHAEHERRYGHRLDMPVELVALRVDVRARPRDPGLPRIRESDGEASPEYHTHTYGQPALVPVFRRQSLGAGHRIEGPAIVVESVATTWIAPGWTAQVDRLGDLRLEYTESAPV
jgi:N-methylhydantoinase A